MFCRFYSEPALVDAEVISGGVSPLVIAVEIVEGGSSLVVGGNELACDSGFDTSGIAQSGDAVLVVGADEYARHGIFPLAEDILGAASYKDAVLFLGYGLDGLAEDSEERVLINVVTVIVRSADERNQVGDERMQFALLLVLFLKNLCAVTALGSGGAEDFFVIELEIQLLCKETGYLAPAASQLSSEADGVFFIGIHDYEIVLF